MAFIRTIPPHAATGAVRDMYARQEDRWGYVPNYAKRRTLTVGRPIGSADAEYTSPDHASGPGTEV